MSKLHHIPVTALTGKQHLLGSIAIVHTAYNRDIVDDLVAGAIALFETHGLAQDCLLCYQAPGAFEIPWVVKTVIESSGHNTSIGRLAGVVTLGAVIRGDTPHFEYVCQAVSNGILEVSLRTAIPVTFGVLTVDTIAQAKTRSSATNNKGAEAANALLHLLVTQHKIQGGVGGIERSRG